MRPSPRASRGLGPVDDGPLEAVGRHDDDPIDAGCDCAVRGDDPGAADPGDAAGAEPTPPATRRLRPRRFRPSDRCRRPRPNPPPPDDDRRPAGLASRSGRLTCSLTGPLPRRGRPAVFPGGRRRPSQRARRSAGRGAIRLPLARTVAYPDPWDFCPISAGPRRDSRGPGRTSDAGRRSVEPKQGGSPHHGCLLAFRRTAPSRRSQADGRPVPSGSQSARSAASPTTPNAGSG